MDDLFGALLGGAESGSDDEAQGQDLLSGLMAGGGADAAGNLAPLLGSLLGGSGQQSGGLTDLLGALGSGTGTGGTGGMMDLLGALGGGAPEAAGGSASGFESFVGPLAEKLGLPPAIVQAVVGVILERLMSGSRGAAAGDDDQALDLAAINEQMSRGGEIDPDYLEATGLTQDVVDRTGLDADEAAASLQQVLAMMTTPPTEN